MPDDKQPPRRSRRWFQFGLSTLMLVTLLAAVLVAWQRERLSLWVESLWPARAAEPVKDPRDPRQVVLDFLDAAHNQGCQGGLSSPQAASGVGQ